LPRFLAAELLPNVPDQRTFVLNENDLQKLWYYFRADNLRKPGKAKKANEFSDANQILKNPLTNWIRAYSLDLGGACHPSDERNNEKESL